MLDQAARNCRNCQLFLSLSCAIIINYYVIILYILFLFRFVNDTDNKIIIRSICVDGPPVTTTHYYVFTIHGTYYFTSYCYLCKIVNNNK